MEIKSCNRESKSCLAKYGIFYQFVYTRVSCSVMYDCIYSNRSRIRIIAAKALADTRNIRIHGIFSPNPL
ncbi:hypothetical protein E2C01_100383 [Portunus trituberculatus]|uniref:Uncharacterized protein n=1 Tax=Portunus trituberculatus TaxID=210409 RepID=A0A5B7K2W3_PORTR|nr:hypothetical protein [Portunus trituberculatus]